MKYIFKNFLYFQSIQLLIIILFGLIITYKIISPLQSLIGIILYLLYIYIFHRFTSYRKGNKLYLFKNDNNILNIFSYTFLTFIIYFIQNIFKCELIPLQLLLYLLIIFTSINIST